MEIEELVKNVKSILVEEPSATIELADLDPSAYHQLKELFETKGYEVKEIINIFNDQFEGRDYRLHISRRCSDA